MTPVPHTREADPAPDLRRSTRRASRRGGQLATMPGIRRRWRAGEDLSATSGRRKIEGSAKPLASPRAVQQVAERTRIERGARGVVRHNALAWKACTPWQPSKHSDHVICKCRGGRWDRSSRSSVRRTWSHVSHFDLWLVYIVVVGLRDGYTGKGAAHGQPNRSTRCEGPRSATSTSAFSYRGRLSCRRNLRSEASGAVDQLQTLSSRSCGSALPVRAAVAARFFPVTESSARLQSIDFLSKIATCCVHDGAADCRLILLIEAARRSSVAFVGSERRAAPAERNVR